MDRRVLCFLFPILCLTSCGSVPSTPETTPVPFDANKLIPYLLDNYFLIDKEKYPSFSYLDNKYLYSTSIEYEYKNETVSVDYSQDILNERITGSYVYKNEKVDFDLKTSGLFCYGLGYKKGNYIEAVKYVIENSKLNYKTIKEIYCGYDEEDFLISFSHNINNDSGRNCYLLLETKANESSLTYDYHQFMKE